MKYALLNTSNDVIRTQDFTDTPPTLPEAKGLRWLEYVDTPQPAFDPMMQMVEDAPVVDGKYTKAWTVVALDAATIAAKQAEVKQRDIAKAQSALAALDLKSIRAMREQLAAMPNAPKFVLDQEAQAVALRRKLK